jgi:putative heme iron utilization protein
MKTMTRGAEARRLVRRFAGGVLATQSLKFPGYPYASSLPFCTDQRGRVVVLVSHLAEHTQNADHDPKAGFLVSPLGRDLQEQSRVSMIGDIAAIDDEATSARYLRYFPEGEQYLQIGGFRFFRIEPHSLRYIAGFGSIHSVAAESYLAPLYPIADAERDVIDHMNGEHAHNLRDYCRHVHGKAATGATMIGIDCDGFDVRADSEILRFDFESEVKDAGEARTELVKLAQESRA